MFHGWLVPGKQENLDTQGYLKKKKKKKVAAKHEFLMLLVQILYAEDYRLVVRLCLTSKQKAIPAVKLFLSLEQTVKAKTK